MVASTSSRSASVGRRAWVNVALAAWLVSGVYLVARANEHDLYAEAERSLYVAPAYAGLAALAIYVVTAIGRAVRRRRSWRSPFEGGYESLPLGFAILLLYTPVDLAWQYWFGLPFGIEGGLAPSRLLLAIGLGLVAIGPIRAVLMRAPDASRLAGTVAVGLTLSLAIFPVGTLHPITGPYAERPTTTTEDDSEVWVMAADGSAQTRVIPAGDGIEVSLPAWSPDGTRIAYTRWQLVEHGDSQGDIWVADANGGNAQALTAGQLLEWIPAWSPDGAWITYTKEPVQATRPVAGSNTAEGPRPGDAPGAGSAQTSAGQIWAVRPDGSEQHQLTTVEGGAFGGFWSPDGTRLAYDSDRTGDFEIYVSGSDGSNEVRLTDDPADAWGPSWSADGTQVLFTSNRGGDNDIWVIGADGSGERQLTDDPADDTVAVWSPDGRRIAFVSDRTGDVEIWTMAPDGTDLVNLTRRPSADDGHWSVAWSRDGRSLAYASAGLGPATTQPIVLEDLAVAGALLLAVAVAVAAMVAVSMGLPFGAVTIVVMVDAVLAALVSDGWRFLPAFLAVGLVVDLLLTRVPRGRRRTVAAMLTPTGLILGYGLTLLAMGSFAWSTSLLLGAALAGGLVGLVIGTLLPAATRQDESA